MRTLLALALAVCCLVAAPASEGAAPLAPVGQGKPSPCADGEWKFTRPAASTYRKVHIANTTTAYVLRPATKPKNKQPAVVLLHGWPGNVCKLWWLARDLAGKGWVTLVVDWDKGDAATVEESAVRTGISATAFLHSSDNPYARFTDPRNISLIGHSLGAHAVAELQQYLDVTTVVALDNLRAYVDKDRSSGTTCKHGSPIGPITPVVPALSIGSETTCYGVKADKLTGYKAWQAAGVPVIQATLAHSIHQHFTGERHQHEGPPDRLTQLKRTAGYVVPWLRFWTRHRYGLYATLVSQHPQGIPVTQMLSHQHLEGAKRPDAFGSAAYMPAFGSWHGAPGCPDLRHCP